MMTVSGTFRTMLTYAVANQRMIGTGPTRIAARTVPQINDPMAEKNVSWIVTQKAPRMPPYSA